MKNSILIIITIYCFFSTSCKKEEVAYPDSSTSIYFSNNLLPLPGGFRAAVDTAAITFGFSPASQLDSVIIIPISVQGLTKPVDRTYKLTVDPASTAQEGVHYSLPASFLIRANISKDTLRLILHRTPEMKTTTLAVILNLEPNENFETNMKSHIPQGTNRTVSFTRLKVVISDMLTRPSAWQNYYHGTYSAKKLYLMNEIAGTPLTAFNNYNNVGSWWYWGSIMVRYFQQQKAAGQTVYEDDGVTEMRMGVGMPG